MKTKQDAAIMAEISTLIQHEVVEVITPIYQETLNALCSEGEERHQHLLRILRLTFPPGPEHDQAYHEVLQAIHMEPAP